MEVLQYWQEMITTVANAYGLDPVLVQAVVWVESSGRADAFRHEPQFWLRYLAKLPEYKGSNPRRVASSYGLMQILYVKAEELGYPDEPEGLFAPRTNLHWGCRNLQKLQQWAEGFSAVPASDRLTAVLAAYNGGTGGNTPGTPLRPACAAYASRVLATVNTLRGM